MSEDIVPVRRMKRADWEAEQEAELIQARVMHANIAPIHEMLKDMPADCTDANHAWFKERYPYSAGSWQDQMAKHFPINTTASEIPKELEHHDNRD